MLQVPKGYSQENLILGLIYAWTTLYFIFCIIPTTVISQPWNRFWFTVSRPVMKLSLKWRKLGYCFFTFAVIVITIFCLPDNPASGSTRVRKLIALFGMLVFITLTWLCSNVSIVITPYLCFALSRIISKPPFFFFLWLRIEELYHGLLSPVVCCCNSCWPCSCSSRLSAMISSTGRRHSLVLILASTRMV